MDEGLYLWIYDYLNELDVINMCVCVFMRLCVYVFVSHTQLVAKLNRLLK